MFWRDRMLAQIQCIVDVLPLEGHSAARSWGEVRQGIQDCFSEDKRMSKVEGDQGRQSVMLFIQRTGLECPHTTAKDI